MGRGTPPKRDRRRTRGTVLRTEVAVITGDRTATAKLSARDELTLVKSALLYADSVEVLSLANHILRDLDARLKGRPGNISELLASLDDQVLRQLGVQGDLKEARAILKHARIADDPDWQRSVLDKHPSLRELFFIAQSSGHWGYNKGLPAAPEFRNRLEQLRQGSGVAELEVATDRKLVRFNNRLPRSADSNLLMDGFSRELRSYLRDPQKILLVDAPVAMLARSLIDQGLVRPPNRATENSSEATLGAGLIARLPAFTTAPMDEILDLRGDLDEPLTKYRRRVAQLRGELRSGPFSDELEADVDSVWRTEVEPAIVDIRQAMADHGLVREMLRTLSGNLSDFAKGVWLPAGVTVFTADMMDLSRLVTASVAAASATVPTVVESLQHRYDGRLLARSHDLFYLYEVDRRLRR